MNVFDFDNTIYDGESFVDIFLMILKRDPSLLKYTPYMLSGVIQYKLGTLRFDTAFAKYSKYFEEYIVTLKDYDGLAVEFWDKHMDKIKPFYKDIQQEDNLVISASLEIVIPEICLKKKKKNYIGSVFDTQTGKIERVCFREKKIDAFFERYPDGKIDCLYTDSMHDKPLMDISEKVFFVKGNKIKQIK